MNIENFLATPGVPCIRVRVAPMGSAYDEVEIDQRYFEDNKEELKEYLESLGDVTAYNWRTMKQFTEGNGLMAKLLIVLGELAGVWQMYPPLEGHNAGLWNKEHPRVFKLNAVVFKPGDPRRVPKPSAGDLDTDKVCVCCERPMGTPDSRVHDLVASEEHPKLCLECALEGCDDQGGPCHVFPEKKAEERQERPQEAEDAEGDPEAPAGLDAYLKQFE